jgi:DHA3 family macrolide efflux protein-like MFS transporter
MGGINFEILKDRNALRIFLSLLVSTICEKMMSIGLVWYFTKNFSINVVPWFLTVSFLPHLFMAFYSTGIINRLGALKTVVASSYFRSAILFLLYGCFFVLDLREQTLLTGLFIAGFFIGLGSSLFNPAILTLPPQLVSADKIVGLNALIDSSMSISTIMGATFAIFLLNIVSLKTLILVNAVSFLISGLLQMGLQSRKQNAESSDQKVPHIGPKTVLKKYPDIARMLGSFLFLNLVFTPILVMIPWYVEKIYKGDSGSLATIEGFMGLGAFLTGLLMSLANIQVKEKNRIAMISLVSFLFGLFFIVFSFSEQTWQGATVLFCIGILSTFLNVQVLTYFQTSLSEEEVPAIMTAVNIISAASVPLSLSFSGLIFPYVNIPDFAKISGVLVVLIALIMPKFLKGSKWNSV